MQNPRLATRYAKSLIDLAQERGSLEETYRDIQMLQSITKSSKELVSLLRSHVVHADKKIKVMEAITGGKVGEITAGFNRLVIQKGRESVLPEIYTAFITQYKKLKNIHVVKLTTAVPVSEELKQSIIRRVQESFDMQIIEMETVVDEKLIGGFTLQAEDKLVDASISYDLRELGRQFENNDFIYKVR